VPSSYSIDVSSPAQKEHILYSSTDNFGFFFSSELHTEKSIYTKIIITKIYKTQDCSGKQAKGNKQKATC
jgi:hypothetical protein